MLEILKGISTYPWYISGIITIFGGERVIRIFDSNDPENIFCLVLSGDNEKLVTSYKDAFLLSSSPELVETLDMVLKELKEKNIELSSKTKRKIKKTIDKMKGK